MSANTTFVIMFVVFVAVLVGAGFYAKRWVRETSDFILAGREVSTFINMMGVIAIGFAGTTVALAPGFSILYGFKNSAVWGIVYGVCGLLLYGVLWAKFIRLNGAQTLPEYLEMRYSAKIRPVVAITSVIGMCGILANNIVSCVSSIVGFTGWNVTATTLVIFLVIIAFTFISGLWAATITDFFQVCIGVVAVPLMLSLLMKKFGPVAGLAEKWMNNDWVNNGISGFTVKPIALTYPSWLNFVILFAAALVWGNNYYWMKIASCRSEKVAKKSFVLAAILLTIIFTIPFGIIGVYAGAEFPQVFTVGGGTLAPTGAYGYLASTFVPLLGAFFVVGACAASISTASTSMLGASAVASRDIYQRLINPNADAKRTLKVSKIIMVFLGILTWILCQFPGGATYLFAFANCWLVPPAILLMFGALWPRFSNTGAFIGALAGMIFMCLFTFLDTVLGVFPLGNYIYLATAGFLVTLVAALIGGAIGKPKYYGEKGWERVPTATNRINVTVDDFDKQVLELIRLGHCYQADITDYMGVDSSKCAQSIEKLDQGGLIMREGLTATKFYTYEITEKGLAAIRQLEGKEAEMAKEHLSPLYVELLKILKENPEKQLDFVKNHQIKSMQMAAISSHLTRQGYIAEKGLFKRKLEVTEKGRAAVEKFA
ncbi:MAG: sodium:solute symporter family protein [Lachnospiraceae bacterium]|nr:sodium:solute symporter family protein [Lachnospiraceae bacterium]